VEITRSNQRGHSRCSGGTPLLPLSSLSTALVYGERTSQAN